MEIVKVSCFPNEGAPQVLPGDPDAGDIVRITNGASVVYERFTPSPSAPTAQTQPNVLRWDALDFMRLFTQAERIAIRTLAKSDAAAEDFLDLLDKAAATGTLVHSNDPDLLAALSAFEAAGVIAEGRAAEIVGS